MQSKGKSPSEVIHRTRWIIPAMLVTLGILYTVVDHIALGVRQFQAQIWRGTIALGIVAPALAWLTLTWAARAVAAQERTRGELGEH